MLTNKWILNQWADVKDTSNAPENFKDKVAVIAPLFNANMDFLRDPMMVPNLQINKLMTLGWRLIGNKVTPVSIVEKMPFGHPNTLHFWAEIKSRDAIALIMVPWEWDRMCHEDRYMQLGSWAVWCLR